MRLCFGLTLAILATGCVYGNTANEDTVSDELQTNELEQISTSRNYQIDETLSVIQHHTIQGGNVEVSLSRESFAETCFVIPPNGEMQSADWLNMDGVTVQQMSEFVSCRITIGPMTRELLGEWSLCGESDKLRCQPIRIQWNNVKNPSARWTTTTRLTVNHPVNYGGTVNPGIADSNNLQSCHVVTPNGEDLVIKDDVKYPHITRTELNNPRMCAMVFDINENMIGDWTIYGMFRFKKGQNEIRLPLTFSLYNANDPYEQAYNVTTRSDGDRLVNLGEIFTQKITGRGKVDACAYITPSQETFDLTNSANNAVTVSNLEPEVACELTIGPVTRELLGDWQFIAKFSNGNLFNENQLSFTLVGEENESESNPPTEAPIQEPPKDSSEESIEESIEEPVAKPVEEERVIENLQEQTIIAAMYTTHRIVINKEDLIENEGCYLITPDHKKYELTVGVHVPGVQILREQNLECGVILNLNHNEMVGQWTLIARAVRLSTPIERRLPFTIRVEGQPISIDSQTWNVGEAVDVTLGPKDAVYCKIEDNSGETVFDNFGQCNVVLNRVTTAHRGAWKMHVALPGNVQLHEISFNVAVVERGNKPVVTTAVATEKPSVLLTCSVPAKLEVNACKFRDPHNKILVASHGVGEGLEYSNGGFISYNSNVNSHDCTLRLTNPSVRNLGIWRCALDTSTGTYYGFLTVVCPFAMQDPYVADSVVTEPVLQPERTEVAKIEDEPVVLRCFVPAPVRYCYFRARNGTVFNVFPGMSSSNNFAYVGSGLDAGECGIRFNSLSASESGNWSCHVGLFDSSAAEQRANINVTVTAPIEVQLTWLKESAIVGAVINHPYTTDRCRFVRMNGEGFTIDNIPDRYTLFSSTPNMCSLFIANPDIIDLHPWTIVAKIAGEDREISATTGHLLSQNGEPSYLRGNIIFWMLIVLLCMMPVVVATALIPKKNREWTQRRASSMRNSFRHTWDNTFGKETVQVQEKEEKV